MPVLIKTIRGESVFFRPGDEIISIDDVPVEDQLDILFRTAGEGRARFTVRRSDGDIVSRRIPLSSLGRAQLVFDEMRFERCRSRCIFCFVDQMPAGLRPTLYEKDDDCRLSFLFGNYITLNDLGDREIGRILSLHLSPLYVSVHAADRRVRERLFGRRLEDDIIGKLETLTEGGVTVHAQVVLVPGVNDGRSLDETIDALAALHPGVRSVAVVPVGLTKHRNQLTEIEPVTERRARELIRWAGAKREALAETTRGERFLFLSDEFYLLTRRALPSYESYGEFWQIANGVGMCRRYLESLRGDMERLRGRAVPAMTIVTGVLGGRFMRRYVMPLLDSRLPSHRVRLLVVRNTLFGRRVGVSGLLAGKDIISAARRLERDPFCLVLPPNAVNHEGFLIDDLRPEGIGREIGVPVLVPETTFLEERIIQGCGGDER